MITKAFQAGQTFKTLDDKIATITRRTEKSVWYSIDGVETRRKIQVVCNEEMIHESKNFDVWADHCKAPQTEVKEIITEVIDETQSVNEESKKIDRRELIDQFKHYSILLNNTEYDTEKWDAIFDKTQELRAAIEKLG